MPITPLELPGWVEFNAWRTGLRPHAVSVSRGSAEGRICLYLDRRGRVKLPPNNPYLALAFRSARDRPSARTADWHEIAGPIAEDIRQRGVANQLYLPPEVADVRPWLWRGFFVGVRYTYYVDLPVDVAGLGKSVRTAPAKAAAAGMVVERVDAVEPVLTCLLETEARQGFSHHLGRRELTALRDLLGPEHLRMYVAFDRLGEVLSCEVLLHAPGARAIAWLGGVRDRGLGANAPNTALQFAFADLAAAGATGVDLAGANSPTIAEFKSHLGARLMTNFGVRTYSARTAFRFAADWWGSRDLDAHGPRRSRPREGP